MSWAVGYDTNWHRDVGYGVPATCDHPGCDQDIDRGLSYLCGGPGLGGGLGCGLHFCWWHLSFALRDERGDPIEGTPSFCERCLAFYAQHGIEADPRLRDPFEPKPDTLEWVEHKLVDPRWLQWRERWPIAVEAMRARVRDEADRWPGLCGRCGGDWHDDAITWWTHQIHGEGEADPSYAPDRDQTPILCPSSYEEGPIPLQALAPIDGHPAFQFPAHWDPAKGRHAIAAEAWWAKRVDGAPDAYQPVGLRCFGEDLADLRNGRHSLLRFHMTVEDIA